MNLDFLSGLLLTIGILVIIYFVIKELVGDDRSSNRKPRHLVTHTLERLSGGKAKPVNEHLIGSVGKVMSHSADSARPMRVRLGLELWSARLDSGEADSLPVGNAVKVVAVDGAVLVVISDSDLAAPSNNS